VSATVNVVRAELFKAFRKRRFYFLAGLYWLLLPAVALVTAAVLDRNLGASFANQSGQVVQVVQGFASPFGMARLALMAPALMSPTAYIIAVALFAGLFIGEERSQHMWKTVLAVQPARLAVLAGKLVAGMIVLGVLLAGALVTCTLAGAMGTLFLPTTFAGPWGQVAGLMALQWLQLLAALLLAYLLVFLVRSGTLGIILVIFLPALLEGLYTVLNTLSVVRPLTRFNAVFQALRLKQAWAALPHYFFNPNLYVPARHPLADFLQSAGTPQGADLGPLGTLLGRDLTLPHAAAVMAGYAAVFLVLLAWLIRRRDVE
jgi:ABC-type transport system involved in multi-copper enzyme maturation permease subunit